MNVVENVFATAAEENSSQFSSLLYCLLDLCSQTACSKIHKETDTYACMHPGMHFCLVFVLVSFTFPEAEMTLLNTILLGTAVSYALCTLSKAAGGVAYFGFRVLML